MQLWCGLSRSAEKESFNITNDRAFCEAVKMLQNLPHQRIVHFLGFCCDALNGGVLITSKFMANGVLQDHLKMPAECQLEYPKLIDTISHAQGDVDKGPVHHSWNDSVTGETALMRRRGRGVNEADGGDAVHCQKWAGGKAVRLRGQRLGWNFIALYATPPTDCVAVAEDSIWATPSITIKWRPSGALSFVGSVPSLPDHEITFSIDENGIFNASALDISTYETSNINGTCNEGRLSEKEIKRMANDAEKFREEDEKERSRVAARHSLENCICSITSKLDDEVMKQKTSEAF
ncbi:heat shock protein 70 [Echinococcus multilocularis]|uniref:Heat shock protein 70 n=1 Tax=Echinococcus multilocularis TaxID=6211 RepID=A0A068XW19_ECHMU|nr:heat shock protein 70 [Echinococcus multilocularis]